MRVCAHRGAWACRSIGVRQITHSDACCWCLQGSPPAWALGLPNLPAPQPETPVPATPRSAEHHTNGELFTCLQTPVAEPSLNAIRVVKAAYRDDKCEVAVLRIRRVAPNDGKHFTDGQLTSTGNLCLRSALASHRLHAPFTLACSFLSCSAVTTENVGLFKLTRTCHA